ncbi:hypothetical protein BDA99DRAFT_520992 [Phascolomyces articulosus]|uniref:Uncharacterized protein n=1 Tax=Phascolomyces articulosus TaxID=60185 RepID=A0AAD5JSL6_9FUNG|nr:hypothetical protein BDA99DRAFT_520992 [Phascolomyces articulosus]
MCQPISFFFFLLLLLNNNNNLSLSLPPIIKVDLKNENKNGEKHRRGKEMLISITLLPQHFIPSKRVIFRDKDNLNPVSVGKLSGNQLKKVSYIKPNNVGEEMNISSFGGKEEQHNS